MSIKYNNKVIAGKYKEQIIPFANTIDAGIAKIATQEQINEGVDGTSIVTPIYLAQKQDKLTAGEGISIDATNTISSKITPDKVTIIENDNKTISAIGRKTVNENIIYDWEGTESEYHQALINGEIDPDWYCYITDDELAVSYDDVLSRTLVNIAPQGEEVIKQLSKENLNNKITNCLTKIPQKIKLELNDGTLTLKAGSKVTIPNGANVFDEIVTTQDYSGTFTGNGKVVLFYIGNAIGGRFLQECSSGTTNPATAGTAYYDTDDNHLYYYYANGTEFQASFPFAICTVKNQKIVSIDKVFNGIGFIGNTLFANKGIEGLISNGFNDDGTLNNIEFETTEVMVRTRNMSGSGYLMLSGTNFHNSATAYYDEKENKILTGAGDVLTNAIVGTWSADSTGKIIEIDVKRPFRAVDYQENKKELATKLNKTQITNCVLELPQTINLEIVDGELVLKKGSTFILPNGAGNFERITTTTDLKRATFGTGTYNELYIQMHIPNSTGEAGLSFATPSNVTVGTEQPTSGMWYNTNENKIINYTSSGAENAIRSFPIAVVKLESGVVTEIKQVFNGLGHFGIARFVDANVKMLISNGFNDDGTLNNIEYTTTKVAVTTDSRERTNEDLVIASDGSIGVRSKLEYDKQKNKNYNHVTGKYEYNCVVAKFSTTTTQTTMFEPKQTFRAVDYNDLDTKVSKSGDTMTGWLSVEQASAPTIQNVCTALNVTDSVAPASNLVAGRFVTRDKNGTISGLIQTRHTTSNNIETAMSSYRIVNGATKSCSIVVGVKADGTAYAFAPTVATGDNSTNIATTKWVNTNAVKRSELAECQVVVETYTNGTSWYRVWSDGWCEQGGIVTGSATSTGGVVTLLKVFSNANYTINALATLDELTNTTVILVKIGSITPTSFACQTGYSQGTAQAYPVRWEAKGYIN